MKNEHPRSSSEQDDIVNSLITNIAVIDFWFTTFLTVTDCVLALSEAKWI